MLNQKCSFSFNYCCYSFYFINILVVLNVAISFVIIISPRAFIVLSNIIIIVWFKMLIIDISIILRMWCL